MNITARRALRHTKTDNSRPRAYENTDGRPSWSPDGQHVAADRGQQVVILDRESGAELSTVGPKDKWVHSPDWSPQGDRIAYSVYQKHRDYKLPSWGIYTSRPDGTDAKLLTPHGREPEYNADGSLIAFHLLKDQSKDRIAVMGPEGENLKPVSIEGTLQRDLSWNSDGEQIAYDTVHPDGTHQTRVTDKTGKKDRMLTHGEARVYYDKNPEWAPKGSKVLFERHSTRNASNGLWTVDTRSGKKEEILGFEGRHLDATWSPDGSKIAFVSNRDDSDDLDLFVMNADGTEIEKISEMTGDEHAPSWSPDGQALAFKLRDESLPFDKRYSVHIVDYSSERARD